MMPADNEVFCQKSTIMFKSIEQYMETLFFFKKPFDEKHSKVAFNSYFQTEFFNKLKDIIHNTTNNVTESFEQLRNLYIDYLYWDMLFERFRYGIKFCGKKADEMSKINFVANCSLNLKKICPTFPNVSDHTIASDILSLYNNTSFNRRITDIRQLDVVRKQFDVIVEIIEEMAEDKLFTSFQKGAHSRKKVLCCYFDRTIIVIGVHNRRLKK